MDRKTLRQHGLHQRESLDDAKRETLHQKITHHFLALPSYQQAQHVGFYWNEPSEVATRLLIEEALASHKCVYLPFLNHKTLSFYRYTSDAVLVKNRFGIEEPNPATAPSVHLETLDVLVMPLVAFDARGQRLGRGAGHYDRTLADLFSTTVTTEPPNPKRPTLVGLAYGCQQVDAVPAESWDVPLDTVVTEHGALPY